MSLEYLKNQVAIVGVGYTPQGKVPGRTAASFHIEAIRNAIQDAGISKNDIGALMLYRHFDAIGGDYETTAFTVGEQLGVSPALISQEHQCTRSWLYYSVGLLMSRLVKYVVISYADNARSAHRSFVKELSGGKATDELASYGDLSTMAKYAMLARRAMESYGTGPEVWKEISIAQRRWAQLNPIAGMYGKPLDAAGYFAAPAVIEPFRLLDATPASDGGRAIVLTLAENAQGRNCPPVYLRGIGSANRSISAYRMNVEDENTAAAESSRMAFRMAGITHKDVDACELYDCFTYTVEATLRDYGFFRREEVRDFLTAERLGPGGVFPVNTSGGMLSEGYFMGLTPVAEAVMQLRGECGQRQLGTVPGTKTPEIIVCSDNGGVFHSHATLVLGREAK